MFTPLMISQFQATCIYIFSNDGHLEWKVSRATLFLSVGSYIAEEGFRKTIHRKT